MSDHIGGVKKGQKLGFVEAAKAVLREEGGDLNYREITERAIQNGILDTKGKTPEITMHVLLMQSIREAQQGGGTPDLVKTGRGRFALVAKGPPNVDDAARAVRAKVVTEIVQSMRRMDADHFHKAIADLMVEMGYTQVEIVDGPGDRQVDVKGTIEAGGVPLKVGVQAKCFKAQKSVSEQAVRALRDALEVHECWHGWFITTGSFTDGARSVPAELATKRPVTLTDGPALAELMIENQVGIELVHVGVPRVIEGGHFGP